MTLLSQIDVNTKVKIINVTGGSRVRQKLNLMGVTEGKVIRIISNFGSVTIEVDRNVVSIGKGISNKIEVI